LEPSGKKEGSGPSGFLAPSHGGVAGGNPASSRPKELFESPILAYLTHGGIPTTVVVMQKILLWSLAGTVSLLLMVNLVLGLGTRGSINKIQAIQAQVSNGPQMEMVLRNLSIRIAMAGEKDAAFKDLLKKHELNVKLEEGDK
jgi:hypothetical protein